KDFGLNYHPYHTSYPANNSDYNMCQEPDIEPKQLPVIHHDHLHDRHLSGMVLVIWKGLSDRANSGNTNPLDLPNRLVVLSSYLQPIATDLLQLLYPYDFAHSNYILHGKYKLLLLLSARKN